MHNLVGVSIFKELSSQLSNSRPFLSLKALFISSHSLFTPLPNSSWLLVCFLSVHTCLLWVLHIKENLPCGLFVWLLWFSIVFSRLTMLQHVPVLYYFVFSYCIVICIFFIHSAVDKHLGCFHFGLLWIMLLGAFLYKFSYGYVFSSLR